MLYLNTQGGHARRAANATAAAAAGREATRPSPDAPDPHAAAPRSGAADGRGADAAVEGVRGPATYVELFRAIERAGGDVANRKSRLRAWMTAQGRRESDEVGPELGAGFDDALSRYRLHLAGEGVERRTVAESVSRMRAVQRLAADLFVVTLAPEGAPTFAAALSAACRAAGLSCRGVARRAAVDKSRLHQWCTGAAMPRGRDAAAAVARLEEVLGLHAGTLASLLAPAIRSAAVGDRTRLSVILRDSVERRGGGFAALARDSGVDLRLIHSWVARPAIPGPESRARDLPRLEAALALPQGSLNALLPPLRPADLPYAALLTPAQRAELSRYVRHKTDLAESRRDRRPREFWRVRAGACPTAGRFERMLASYYGFLELPADAPDPLLRGLGRAPGTACLTDLADVDALRAYLAFRAERSRHTWFARKVRSAEPEAAAGAVASADAELSGYNEETLVTLASIASMLRPETGYLWQGHDLLPAVRAAAPSLDGGAALARWRDRVGTAWQEVVDYRQHLKACDLVAPTYDYAHIARILEAERPMDVLGLLQERARKSWEDAAREFNSPKLIAARLRDYLLLLLLCVTPLRLSHWRAMRYRPDGTGHLRRVTDPSKAHVGHYELFFRRAEFKALADFRDEDYVAEVPREFTPIIELYLTRHWPVLRGPDTCEYVFRAVPWKSDTGADQEVACVDDFVAAATARLLPEYVPRGMRTHAFRHIIATHLVRTYPDDGVTRAADALHNTVAMIKLHYGHLTGRDRTRRSMQILHAEYRGTAAQPGAAGAPA